MLIVCSCCKDPVVRGDETNSPLDEVLRYFLTRVYVKDETSSFESTDGLMKVRRVHRSVMEQAGLVWAEEAGFWALPNGLIISAGYEALGGGVSAVTIEDGKAS